MTGRDETAPGSAQDAARDKDWRRDEGKGSIAADGDSDDVADSPSHGRGSVPTPGDGDSDDLADDRQ